MNNLNNPSGCMHLRKRRNARRNMAGDLLSWAAAVFLFFAWSR